MIEQRCHHASVTMGNKMFVIGGCYTSTCEILDSYSRKFSYIKSMNLPTKYLSHYESAVCISQTIIAFSMERTEPYGTKIIIYDVNKNQWTEKNCSVLTNLTAISCAKYYTH